MSHCVGLMKNLSIYVMPDWQVLHVEIKKYDQSHYLFVKTSCLAKWLIIPISWSVQSYSYTCANSSPLHNMLELVSYNFKHPKTVIKILTLDTWPDKACLSVCLSGNHKEPSKIEKKNCCFHVWVVGIS